MQSQLSYMTSKRLQQSSAPRNDNMLFKSRKLNWNKYIHSFLLTKAGELYAYGGNVFYQRIVKNIWQSIKLPFAPNTYPLPTLPARIQLFESQENVLYAICNFQGLWKRINEGWIQVIKGDFKHPVQSCYQSDNGMLYALSNYGIYYYQHTTDVWFYHLLVADTDESHLYLRWIIQISDTKLYTGSCWKIYELTFDSSGDTWQLSNTVDLPTHYFAQKGIKLKSLTGNLYYLQCGQQDSPNKITIPYQYDAIRNTWIKLQLPFFNAYIKSILSDRQSRIWFLTSDGLYQYQPQIDNFEKANIKDEIKLFFIARDGSLIACTAHLIYILPFNHKTWLTTSIANIAQPLLFALHRSFDGMKYLPD